KRNSKLPSETVVLLVLCVLLAAALIIIIRLFFVILVSNKSVQTVREENEALRKNLSEITWGEQPTCPPPPSCPPESHNQTCLKCGGHWEFHGGKCYYFSTCGLNWTDSRSFCRDVGGDLVKIDSREEQEFLVRKLRDFGKIIGESFWIGLTDSETEDRWLWADGSPLDESLKFWFSGEPNNMRNDHPDGEDCVALKVIKTAADPKTWNDCPCNSFDRIICEKPRGSAQSSCV
ncbi:C-type lectin domain family 4 member E, partial [Austrofundulus limnaeus]|uniref:C-type lectin domain family 4 member E n=1 Tax=Austrofundulus limnaeus TaxID=52670 RepID=A0A2I4AMQ0_AUSLI